MMPAKPIPEEMVLALAEEIAEAMIGRQGVFLSRQNIIDLIPTILEPALRRAYNAGFDQEDYKF